MLSGSTRLIVRGDIEVETFIGNSTDQYVNVGGDLRAGLTILWDEFVPEVGGRLVGRALVPGYLDLAAEGLAVEDPAPQAGLAELVEPELLLAATDGAGDDLYLADAGLRYERMLGRIIGGLPVIRAGRTVAALEELPAE